MTLQDLRAELSVKAIEFEQALDQRVSTEKLRELYRELKELQYKITMAQVSNASSMSNEFLSEDNFG